MWDMTRGKIVMTGRWLMWASRLCLAFSPGERKCFVLVGTGQLYSSPRPPTSFSKGAGGATSGNCLLNYAPAETGVLQFFFQGRPAESGVYSKCILHPHFSPSLWTAERPVCLCVLVYTLARVCLVPRRPLCT